MVSPVGVVGARIAHQVGLAGATRRVVVVTPRIVTIAITAFALVLAGLGEPRTAEGQTRVRPQARQLGQDPRERALESTGSLLLQPSIELRNFGVDTNVFHRSEAESDFTFTLRPRLIGSVPFGRSLFRIDTFADMVYYQEFDTERSLDPTLNADVEFVLRRLSLFVDNRFSAPRQRVGFDLDARARQIRHSLETGLRLQVTPRLRLDASGRFNLTRFDGDEEFQGTNLAENLNRDSIGWVGALRYRLTPLTTFALETEVVQQKFNEAEVRDSDAIRVLPGVEFQPRALISGEAFVGYQRLEGTNPALPDFTGLVALVGVTYRMLGTTVFDFTAQRDVEYSFNNREPYYLLTALGADLTHRISGRVEIGGGIERRNLRYERLLSAESPLEPQRVDRVWRPRARFAYELRRDLRVGLDVLYTTRDSNTRGSRAFDGWEIGFSFRYGL